MIYPPSPDILQRSRERAVKGRNARRLRRLALDGLARLCYFRQGGGGISSRAAPFPMNGKGRGDRVDTIYKKQRNGGFDDETPSCLCDRPVADMEQAAHYCRVVYDAGYSPICPVLYLSLFLDDGVPEEHKSGIDMGRDLLRRSRVLVVCGSRVNEAVKNDIAVAQRLGITATTLDGILTVKGQGRR